MKLAYFVIPHLGGTYSVFTALRLGLARYGVDVRWFGLCDENFELLPGMEGEEEFGTMVRMPSEADDRDRAALILEMIRSQGFSGVFVNVLGDRFQTNIARYLPEKILRILVVHNITPGTYAAARVVRDYAHVTIGVSERCRDDLVRHYGFPQDRTVAIANAIDTAAFADMAATRGGNPPELRMLFAGRIEDGSKGVLWLREILDALPEPISLTVVGDGPDLAKLRRRLTVHEGRVRFTGAVSSHAIPAIMAEHDVLIMPSRFEGLGMTLIEAMAGGCVPVVSHIRGVTDTVVEDGANGILFPVGNYTAAAHGIARLNDDRDLLARMSAAGREMVSRRYSIATMAARYHAVIASTMANRPLLPPALDIDAWSVPQGLRPGLRSAIPLPLKNWLRVLRERL
ncbi:MAG: glycosyltransferase family 1 protein [Oxalobacteraceae bacterium]|nr:MAG: glycosyltransferase family 1 protein [Oxalobacteraceae bacterium]